MFYIFITVFLIASGLTAADESCSRSLDEVCRPDTDRRPFAIKNAEDFDRSCGMIIKYFECGIEHEERCHTDSGFLPEAYQILATFQEVCNRDTLLNAAIRENIACVFEKVKDEDRHCFSEMHSEETLERQAEELSKDLEALTYNDEDEEDRFDCLIKLNHVACQAILTEKKCGTVAKYAFIEVVRKLPLFQSCTKQAIQKLPTIIRLRELESVVEEVLERKKK